MVRPQPPKVSANRSFPGASAKIKLMKSQLSTIVESKAKQWSGSSDENESDTPELEELGKMKKNIERKQAALKEKVQQIINYSSGQKA